MDQFEVTLNFVEGHPVDVAPQHAQKITKTVTVIADDDDMALSQAKGECLNDEQFKHLEWRLEDYVMKKI